MNDDLLRYLDDRDSLTEEELRKLAASLEEQPAELSDLRAQLAMSDLLSRRHDEQRAMFVARVKQAAGRDEVPQASRNETPFVATVLQRLGLANNRPWFRLPRPFAYAAAALVAVLLTLATQWTLHRHDITSLPRPVELEVLEATDSVASDTPSGWSRGARIALSELRMPSGFLRFRLDSGAVVAVTGPAELQLLDPMHLRVRHGRVTADVGENAKGFVVDTDQTQVVDLGTKFGVDVSASGHTDVVVFQGKVELFDRKAHRQQDQLMTQLVEGEAVRVNARQQLSRIVNVTSGLRDEGWSTREGDGTASVITSVRDNLRDPQARNFYRIVPNGLQEDARAFVGQRHEWNGLTSSGIPASLKGADLVQTFINDRLKTALEITITVSRPAVLYVLFDSRYAVPAWLSDGFTDTGDRIGLENAPTLDSGRSVAKGPAAGNMAPFAVWKRDLPQAGSVTLGAPREASEQPMLWMYGIAARPL